MSANLSLGSRNLVEEERHVFRIRFFRQKQMWPKGNTSWKDLKYSEEIIGYGRRERDEKRQIQRLPGLTLFGVIRNPLP